MALEKFHYPATDDPNAIVVSRLDQVPVGVIRKSRHLEKDEQVFAIIEEIADAKNLAKIDKLTAAEFGAFVQAWEKSGALAPGE